MEARTTSPSTPRPTKAATEAKKKLGIYLKYVEASDDNAFEPLLRAFAQKDFDLIIGIGFAQKETIKKVAAQFPAETFCHRGRAGGRAQCAVAAL